MNENMRYKVLINGGDQIRLIEDFFQYSEKYFRVLSTSIVYGDVLNHFNEFQPDVYVIFMDSPYSPPIEQLGELKENRVYNNAPIIIVGRTSECFEFEKSFPGKANLIIRRPISSDNIALSIISFLERGSVKIRKEGEKKRLLIVDDDRTVLKMVKAALEEDYEVTCMLNGSLVEKFLSANEVDMIILDYEMPFMTGADIYRMLKGKPQYSKIPVCFLTGVSERSKVEEIMALKPRGYLLKPLNIEMLIATIENLT